MYSAAFILALVGYVAVIAVYLRQLQLSKRRAHKANIRRISNYR